MVFINILFHLICVFHVNLGFLLQNGTSFAGSGHFLTVQTFLGFQSRQDNAIIQLRQTMDQSFALLTKQLAEKFKDLEQLSINNGTCTCNALQQMYDELANNVLAIQNDLKNSKMENQHLRNQMNILANHTEMQELNLDELKVLAEVQAQLQLDYASVKHQLATMLNKNKVIKEKQTDLQKQLHEMKLNTSAKISDNINLANGLFNELNDSVVLLSKEISEMGKTVSITACANRGQNGHGGYIVKFQDIRTSVGITDKSLFISTGKFLCEQDGIYLLYATLEAYNTFINFDIYINDREYVRVYESNADIPNQRGDVTVTFDLLKGDAVWIQLGGHMLVNSVFSCLTVVKIK